MYNINPRRTGPLFFQIAELFRESQVWDDRNGRFVLGRTLLKANGFYILWGIPRQMNLYIRSRPAFLHSPIRKPHWKQCRGGRNVADNFLDFWFCGPWRTCDIQDRGFRRSRDGVRTEAMTVILIHKPQLNDWITCDPLTTDCDKYRRQQVIKIGNAPVHRQLMQLHLFAGSLSVFPGASSFFACAVSSVVAGDGSAKGAASSGLPFIQ